MLERVKPRFKRILFVCTNQRTDGRSCCSAPGQETGSKLKELLKERVKEKNLGHLVRISSSGCQDSCAQGPTILISPDHLWLHGVQLSQVDEILEEFVEPLANPS